MLSYRNATKCKSSPEGGLCQASEKRGILARLGESQTVIPRVRERLGIQPGDRLRYHMTDKGVLLDKAPAVETDWLGSLQATFTEWATPEDAAAYDDL